MSVSDSSAIESDGEIVFEVSIDEPADSNIWVATRILNGSAKVKRDFWGFVEWVNIAPGETSGFVSVPLIDDKDAERDERLRIRIIATNARRGDRNAIGVIYDNDSTPRAERFELDILHMNDHHSHLEADDLDFFIGDEEVDVEIGGFGRIVEAFATLEDELGPEANVAKVHAGDAITGTLFYTLFAGEADAALMNEICFDIFALGNHEFDAGDAGLVTFLDFLNAGDCGTPTLAANVVPEIGTPLAPVNQDDYIRPFVVEEYDGEKVGFIGIDIAQKTQISSQPDDTTVFLDEVETAQLYTDLLTAVGVNKIVLVTHYGYENDLDLLSQVAGVDVVVGGDSHSRLGDLSAFGLSSAGAYPTVTTDAAGNTACVVQAWEYGKAIGHLNVGFDNRGRVTSCEGTPHLLLGEIRDLDEDGNGTALDASVVEQYIVDNGQKQYGTDADADALFANFAAQVDELASASIGTASEDLCLGRFPNDGRDNGLCGGSTPNGGEIQQLVAQAFLDRAFNAEISLQNSGGVRINIPAGDISIADAYELLPFANTMVEIELTGAEVVLALEQGLSNTLDNGGSSGAFPYGAGIRWDLDTTQPFESRFTNVEVQPKGTDTYVAIDPTATYTVVVNSFMAGGGDGYFVLADAVADGRATDLFIDYAQTFIDWVEQDQGGVISKPTEFSLQNYVS
ncbi:MAG: 5'-nucleotidase C-terminal domain-containing protein [Actinomycetota bacterium]